jgi:hypothetical protein
MPTQKTEQYHRLDGMLMANSGIALGELRKVAGERLSNRRVASWLLKEWATIERFSARKPSTGNYTQWKTDGTRARLIERIAKLPDGTVVERTGSPPPPPPPPAAADIEVPPTERVPTTVHRIIRDTELARRVKLLHQYKCQICGYSIRLNNGSNYAEAHHIQPLGKPHDGPDCIENIVCVCPNHHAELDYGLFDLSRSMFSTAGGHQIGQQYLDYHNQHIHCWVDRALE